MESFEHDINKCFLSLEKGETILYPTDTIWGLGCDATNPNAVNRVSDIKNRPDRKSFIVLMSDIQMLRQYLTNPIPDLESFINSQKTATTIIYEQVIGFSDNVLASDGSLGIRIPKDDFCLALLKSFGKPILSTSANLSGEDTPAYYNQISHTIKERVHYVCDWRQDDMKPNKPSSIIKLNADGTKMKIR